MNIVPLGSLPSIEALRQENRQETTEGLPFSEIMESAVESLRESQQAAAEDSYRLAMGDTPDLAAMMIHSAMETTAVETVTQLTSRAVSAYKEIMQMQI